MDMQHAIDIYTDLENNIDALFHNAVMLYEINESQIPLLENAIKELLNNRSILDSIFKSSLDLLEIKKIKNVDNNNYMPSDIFNANKNQIVDSICSLKHKNIVNIYKYNIYAFYIITHEVLEKAYDYSYYKPSQLFFYSEIYRDIRCLFTGYWDLYAKKKYPHDVFSPRKKTYKNQNREEIDILLGIRHLLYGGTVLDAVSSDLPNMAISMIRNYIEIWLKKNFNVYTYNDSNFITMSKIFRVLQKNIKEIKSDPIASTVKNIDRHINTLSQINTWTNFFIHSQRRPFFWKPSIIFKYLNSLIDDCREAYKITAATWSLYPPLIPENAAIYSHLCEAIKSNQSMNC